ncbi:hypothetical protein [Jeotgalicoccus sp. WY2]|uniref:hypothetical protein n=1 Tax=Jeotgalicoccus sp. WY2 TaxID=2708346 RepID=UPI002020AF71|nr:hypothetical protein [Jeotgalicoccus sp. WY2]
MKEFIGYQQKERVTVGEFVSENSQGVNNEDYPLVEEETKLKMHLKYLRNTRQWQ